METLAGWDRSLLLFLNSLHSEGLDPVVLAATSTTFWTPLYLWFIYLMFVKLDRKAWLALVAVALTVLLADQSASGILKPLVGRLRPSHEPGLQDLLHLLTDGSGQPYKGGLYGFPSSHAANAFGVATFLWLTLRKQIRWVWVVFLVAAIISWTRLYAGVHYPSDVLTGALIGSGWAYACWKGFNWSVARWMPEKTATE